MRLNRAHVSCLNVDFLVLSFTPNTELVTPKGFLLLLRTPNL